MMDTAVSMYDYLNKNSIKCRLVLSDGKTFCGSLFGHISESYGFVVFNTAMVGYVESLTDPSYLGQILVFTSPLIGNYGVPNDDKDEFGFQKTFESPRVYPSAIIVSDYSFNYSHATAVKSLDQWLKEESIVGVTGVDTRALTKHLRNHGTMQGQILFESNYNPETALDIFKTSLISDLIKPEKFKRDYLLYYKTTKLDNNHYVTKCDKLKIIEDEYNLDVLCKKPIDSFTGKPWRFTYLHYDYLEKHLNLPLTPNRRFLLVIFDCGCKYNIIRTAIRFGLDNVDILVVPYNFNYNKLDYDGVILGNGPGHPEIWTESIEIVTESLQVGKPIFGICLGNQLLALAAGAKVYKLPYGNRGFNHPCVDLRTFRCYSTTQNHTYSVDLSTLPIDWAPLYVNANDNTVEGIIHRMNNWFGVQYHPEACGGPNDTLFHFYDFFCVVKNKNFGPLHITPISFPIRCRKVLIIGSGGLVIGQAGEFDYSGSQAIKALKETGATVILINPNIATVQTSKGMADHIYFLPITPEFVKKVIEQEEPDGLLCGFGGQTALNVVISLYEEGFFNDHKCQILGTCIESIIATENREIFHKKIESIGLKCAPSVVVDRGNCVSEANKIGYPVLVRASFELGGLGSGIAYNDEELLKIATGDRIYIDKYLGGFKEIEYEILRDSKNNCIAICNMENFDPLGIHTGDSIVVAPSQTLSNYEYYTLRDAAFLIARHFQIVGECNVQFAIDPNTFDFYVIEVNARLSRSSTLASKATSYPIAYMAAMVSMGHDLVQLRNNVTRVTTACFEPALDYVVVKIPKWDLQKFEFVDKRLGTSMKSVGEVMSVGRTFEESFQKAIRMSFDLADGFGPSDIVFDKLPATVDDVKDLLVNPTPYRIFAIAKAFAFGMEIDEINKLTSIDKWFLYKLHNIYLLSQMLNEYTIDQLEPSNLLLAKKHGFSDVQIAKLLKSRVVYTDIAQLRYKHKILPKIRQIDSLSAEYDCKTSYFYYTYNAIDNDAPPIGSEKTKSFIVVGCGPYRIGSSIEFDWSAVQCINTIRTNGYKAVVVNCNPETVSTDSDVSDRLYFEELTEEIITDIYNYENTNGVIVSFGGQVANNLAFKLMKRGVKILGTSVESIDMCENRMKFAQVCDALGLDQPAWQEFSSIEHAIEFSRTVGFPVLVRPSYVLSGAAMRIVVSENELERFISTAAVVSREYPVVISKFISNAKEVEMDCVSADGVILNYAISEHVEKAGVHSGDATLILPAQNLFVETHRRVKKIAQRLSKYLNICGPFNIQLLCKANEIKVIECNLRSSRTMPFISKGLDINFVDLGTRVMIGEPYRVNNIQLMELDYVVVKFPVFSFNRLTNCDPLPGVEMKSTGEVACFGKNKYEATLKTFLASGMSIPSTCILISIGSLESKFILAPKITSLLNLGFKIYATSGTFKFMANDIRSHLLETDSLLHLMCNSDEYDYDDSLHINKYDEKYITPRITTIYEGNNKNEAGEANQKIRHSKGELILVHKSTSTHTPTTTGVLNGGEVELTVNITDRVNGASTTEGYIIRKTSINNKISLITNAKLAVLLFDSIIRERTLNMQNRTMLNATRYDKYN